MVLHSERAPEAAPEGEAGASEEDPATDGRQLRRIRNRETVVDALLDLYRDGNLRPSTEEIAARSGLSPRSLFRYFEDVDDLIRSAIMRQEARAMPFVACAAEPTDALEEKVTALVEQRFRLFDAMGNAAAVIRLRAPFQPMLAEELARNRRFMRQQVALLFAPELEVMGERRRDAILGASDVLTSYESYRLLTDGRSMSSSHAGTVVADAITALFGGSSE